MCGRFVAASSPQLLAERFEVDENRVEEHEPSYNVAPRADVIVVRQREGRRVMSELRWGLVPSWADGPEVGDRMINARAEGIAEDGFRLIINCNKHGGQVVYHLHMHLVGGAMLGPMLSGGKHG